MNAAGKIQAAIEKLEKSVGVYEISNEWLTEIDTDIKPPDDPRVPLTNDPLIVMLYRTIDAQLAILRDAANGYWSYGDAPDAWDSFESSKAALALAEAILA